MRSLRPLLGLMLLAVVGAAGAARADEASVRKELTVAYGKFVKEFKAKDARAIIARLTPDYQIKSVGGRVLKRAEAVKSIQEMMQAIKEVKSRTYKFDKVVAKGNTAILTVSEKIVVTIPGAQGADHELVVQGVNRETFVKGGGGWKLKRTDEIRQTATLDGRPFPVE